MGGTQGSRLYFTGAVLVLFEEAMANLADDQQAYSDPQSQLQGGSQEIEYEDVLPTRMGSSLSLSEDHSSKSEWCRCCCLFVVGYRWV